MGKEPTPLRMGTDAQRRGVGETNEGGVGLSGWD